MKVTGTPKAVIRLHQEIIRRQLTTPCAGDDRFISDRHPVWEVAPLCHTCPVLELCKQAGESAEAGVWGGIRRTPPEPRKAGRPPRKKAA